MFFPSANLILYFYTIDLTIPHHFYYTTCYSRCSVSVGGGSPSVALGNSSPAKSNHSSSPVSSPLAATSMSSPLAIIEESPEQEQDDEKEPVEYDDDDNRNKPNNNNKNNNNNNNRRTQATNVFAVASADTSRDDENSHRDGDDEDTESPSHNNTAGVHVQRVSSGGSTRSRFGWNNNNNNNKDNEEDDYMFSESDSKHADRDAHRSSAMEEKGIGKDHKQQQHTIDEKEDDYGMETVFSGVRGGGGAGSSGRPAVAPRASWNSSPSPAKGTNCCC